jgi:hypothetical protein
MVILFFQQLHQQVVVEVEEVHVTSVYQVGSWFRRFGGGGANRTSCGTTSGGAGNTPPTSPPQGNQEEMFKDFQEEMPEEEVEEVLEKMVDKLKVIWTRSWCRRSRCK